MDNMGCKKCVFHWIGLDGCDKRRIQGECNKSCPYFVHINTPQGNLMVCEYKRQKDKLDKETE